jgi:sugar/nucleoside kinase (ribokinase family)
MVGREYDLMVIGELNVDLILNGGDVVPEFGQKEKLVEKMELVLGSSSAIFACGAAKLGLKTAFIGKLGQDACGSLMLRTLQAAGVATPFIIIDPAIRTGLSVNLVRASDRAILTYLGSIAALDAAEVDLSAVRRARHLHVSSYFMQKGLQQGLARVFAAAREAGLTVSFDTGWDPQEKWDADGTISKILAHVNVFMPNQEEARAITGASSLEETVERLSRQVEILVVKRGERGALARRDAETWEQPAFPVEVVDTIGAGDSFNAGFLYGYLGGLSLAESLRLGCACGALSITKPGGTAGQPTWEELQKFLQERKEPPSGEIKAPRQRTSEVCRSL